MNCTMMHVSMNIKLHSSIYFASFRKFNETRNVASSTDFYKLLYCKLYFINRNKFVSELKVN